MTGRKEKQMITSKYEWQFAAPFSDDTFLAQAKKRGLEASAAKLLGERGIQTEEALDRFLEPRLEDLHDPYLLNDMDKAVDRIRQAIEDYEQILVYGDYDADGMTAASIMKETLEQMGAEVAVYLPNRFTDGYGPNASVYKYFIEQQGISLIITVDNGVAGHEAIDLAQSMGVDVIVTDHHAMPEVLPDAYAVIHPEHPDADYPFKHLAGCGVAFKLATALLEEVPLDFLDLVAIGTIADMVSLTDENRILVKEGLNRIHRTKNPGMRALIFQNHLEPEQINAYHFGFVLGPCINASGRLDTAKLSLSLFLQGEEEAAKTARELVELNQQRKDMTADGVEEAKRVVEEHYMSDKVLVIYLPQVHESLAGIIAGRIREAYHKPVFVLTKAEEGVKGSGRSIEEYSMYEELCKCRELLEKFGGHPMAAGLSLPEENVDKFREKINACANLTEDDLIPKIKIDIPMPAAYADAGLIREFAVLEPFGKANIKPQFADKNLSITKAFVVGKNQNVLRLNLVTAAGEAVSAVYFGDIEAFKAYYAEKYGSAEVEKAFRGQINKLRIMIVYYPEINEYNGVESVQVIIRNYQ